MVVIDYKVVDDEVLFYEGLEGDYDVCLDLDCFRDFLSMVVYEDSLDKDFDFFDTVERYELSGLDADFITVRWRDGITVDFFNKDVSAFLTIRGEMFSVLVEDLLDIENFDRYPNIFVMKDGSNLIFVNGINNSKLCVEREEFLNSILSLFKNSSSVSTYCNEDYFFNIVLDDDISYNCRMCWHSSNRMIYLMRNNNIGPFIVCMSCADIFMDIFMEDYNNDILSHEL
jgi:hypothetical protein